jgi:hypothetical protein
MGKYSTDVKERLQIPARVLLTGDEDAHLRSTGRTVPGHVPVRLIVDTGSKRSTLLPSVITHLNPSFRGSVKVETSMGFSKTNLFWVRLEFPQTSLAPIPEIAVARVPMPSSLAAYHGVIGRDLLSRWEFILYEGVEGRLTIRDQGASWFRWLVR